MAGCVTRFGPSVGDQECQKHNLLLFVSVSVTVDDLVSRVNNDEVQGILWTEASAVNPSSLLTTVKLDMLCIGTNSLPYVSMTV